MSFKDFINELAIPSTGEQQVTDDRADARAIVGKTRGLRQGVVIDANGNSINSNSAGKQSSDAFVPNNMQQGTQAATDAGDKAEQSMILKNTPAEVVYVTKGDDGVFITIVNKQRFTKRTIALDTRGSTLLKRYI